MPVYKIPLNNLGVVTVEEMAAYHQRSVRLVQRWITEGRVPAFVIGSGGRTIYLIPVKEMKLFKPDSKRGPKAAHTIGEKSHTTQTTAPRRPA